MPEIRRLQQHGFMVAVIHSGGSAVSAGVASIASLLGDGCNRPVWLELIAAASSSEQRSVARAASSTAAAKVPPPAARDAGRQRRVRFTHTEVAPPPRPLRPLAPPPGIEPRAAGGPPMWPSDGPMMQVPQLSQPVSWPEPPGTSTLLGISSGFPRPAAELAATTTVAAERWFSAVMQLCPPADRPRVSTEAAAIIRHAEVASGSLHAVDWSRLALPPALLARLRPGFPGVGSAAGLLQPTASSTHAFPHSVTSVGRASLAFPFAASSSFPLYRQQHQLPTPPQQLQPQSQMLQQQRQVHAAPTLPTLLPQTPMLMQQMLQPTLQQNQMQMQLIQQQQQQQQQLQQQMQMHQNMQQQILYSSQVLRPGQWQSLAPPSLLPSPPQPQQQLLQPLQQWQPHRQESNQDLPASFFFDARPAQLPTDGMRQLQSRPSVALPAVAALGLEANDHGLSAPAKMRAGVTAEPTSDAAPARIPAKKKLRQVQAASAAQRADPSAVAAEKGGQIKASSGAAASDAPPEEVDATAPSREAREAGEAGDSKKGPEESQTSARKKRRRAQPGDVYDVPSDFGLVAIKQLPATTTLRELRAACDGSQGLIACSFDPQLSPSDGFRSAHAVYDTAARARKASRRLDLVWANPARANRVFANAAMASRIMASDRGIAHPEDEHRRRTGPRLVPRRRHEHATGAPSDDGLLVPDDDAMEAGAADATASADGERKDDGGGKTTEEWDAGGVDALDAPAADAPTADSTLGSESLGPSSVRPRKRKRSSRKSRAQVVPDEPEGEGEPALSDVRVLPYETTLPALRDALSVPAGLVTAGQATVSHG